MGKSSLVWRLSFYEYAIPNQSQAEFRLIPNIRAETCHSKAFHVPGTGIMAIWLGGNTLMALKFSEPIHNTPS